MTAEEKTALALFLDTAAGFLGDGFRRGGEDWSFSDDSEAAPPQEEKTFSSLPLAYQVDEEDGMVGQISEEIAACSACPLSAGRTSTVSGEGPDYPLVMVIGEGPGAEEDASGRPFVGKAGRLLDRMLSSVGLSREKNCFITNVVKCRPPDNRDPRPEDIAACAPFLERQIALLKPLIILCAGRAAAQYILHTEEGINRLRGRFGEYPAAFEITETGTLQSAGATPVPVLPTYHPSALLRDEDLKRPAFADLKLLMAKLAALDSGYRKEVKPLLTKYAAGDGDFAEKVRAYLE
jgi:DNA polymerase